MIYSFPIVRTRRRAPFFAAFGNFGPLFAENSRNTSNESYLVCWRKVYHLTALFGKLAPGSVIIRRSAVKWGCRTTLLAPFAGM